MLRIMHEAYKYVAFDTFQQNWDLDAIDFYQMFRNSFSKAANLVLNNNNIIHAVLYPEK